jgi:EAL domain-containing protein (putative c-di-GMP-specific phosphodiesterase class I)
VSVGIEDFGTGDVSLEALHRLRIGWLKLDRTVSRAVADHPRRRELAAGIGALARGMGIEAIAEGVEEEADRDALGALGYVLGQGWYWSEAVPADALVARYLEPAVDDGASGVADGGRS